MARLAASFLPSTAVLEMTYRCNHKCLFCSCPWERSDSDFEAKLELTTQDWKRVLSKLCKMGVENIAFTGGEALLRDDLFDIICHARQLEVEHISTEDGKLSSTLGPPKLYLLSNGLLVDESVLHFCGENDVQLSMSLPGLKTYRMHTGSDNVDHVLEMFSQARKLDVDTVANIAVTRLNLTELHQTISAALLAGATQILLNRFMPGGRGLANASELSLNSSQVREMLTVAERVLQKAHAFGSLGTEVPKCIVEGLDFERLSVSTKCGAAVDFFVIGPGGYVRVCNHSEKRLARFDQIESLKDDGYWRTFVFRNYLPEQCTDCQHSYECDGGCREAAHIVGGSVDSQDVLLDQA